MDDLNFIFFLYGIDHTLHSETWELHGEAAAIGEILLKHPYYTGLLWDQIYYYLDDMFSEDNYNAVTSDRIDTMEATLLKMMSETDQIEDAEDEEELLDKIQDVRDVLEAMHEGINDLYAERLQLQIIYPTTDEPVRAGAYNSPGKIWVMVSGRTKDHFEKEEFAVEVGGEDAYIVSGLNLQNQFWMVVEAPDMSSSGAGEYDLTVTDTIGESSVTYPDAVVYQEEGIPVDSVIVGDISGSMSYCGKLEAAQNAARLFVDHAGDGDQIGVLGFSTNVYPGVSLLDASSESNLDAAKDAIDDWETHNLTAIGKGIMSGQDLFDDGNGDPEHDWKIALLSDGKETDDPYWAEVKDDVFEKIQIDAVALGADADIPLMTEIADATEGSLRFAAIAACPELPSLTSFLTTSKSTSSAIDRSIFGVADMTGLSNELADIYKGFAEDARMEDRIGDWTGALESIYGLDWDEYYITLESGLPEAIFAVNWDGVGTSPLMMYINDMPVGDLVEGETTLDATHVQYRLPNPTPGEYKITVAYDYDPADEIGIFYETPYRMMVSAKSLTNALAIPDSVLDSLNYNMDWDSIPVNSYVGDEDGPISGPDTTVTAVITTPSGDEFEIPLDDNGSGSDGDANDGLYGGSFTPTEEGAYSIVIEVEGIDNDGDDFKRRKPTVIVVGPESDDTSGGSSGGSGEASVCVLGESSVDLRDRAVVTADVAAGTYLEIGAPSTLNGDGFVGGDAYIRSYGEVIGWGVVNGDLTLAGTLSHQEFYTITGLLTENGTPSIPALSTKTFATGTDYQYLTGVQTLTPGTYGDVGIGGNAEITLDSGVYNFASLSAWNDVIFNVTGDVEINVQNDFVFGDRSTIVGGESLTVYTNASQVRIGTDVVFNGVLIAPNADVTVYSRTVFNGCIGAENLVLDTDVTLEQSGHALFESTGSRKGSCFDWIQNGPEAGVDCGGDCRIECKEVCYGQACTELGEPCDENADCISNYCDDDFFCSTEPPAPVCSESTAIDLGAPQSVTMVQNDGCVMVRDEYPWWWGTRTMLLQTSGAAEYPLWFTWSNACTGNGGTEMFSTAWQNVNLYQTSNMCATVMDFQGSGNVTISVTYYGG